MRGIILRIAEISALGLLAATASACSSSTASTGSASADLPPKVAADDLFLASCTAYWPGDAMEALLMGFDGSDIKRINKALRLAERAAEIDQREYGLHANEMRRFAESLGQLMAVHNDPASDYQDEMAAARQVHIPANDCPTPPPDSGGLPLPDQP